MKKCLAILLLTGTMVSCSEVPVTGRKQLAFLNNSELQAMSLQAYNEFLQSNKVVNNSDQAATVKRVGQRIQKAVETFMRENNMANRLDGFRWEFNLVQDKAINAWAMPGGKVVVYTGLMDVAQTEAGLAAVMGHEIAHAIANHGNERMSQGLATQLGLQVGQVALSSAMSEKPQQTKNLFLQTFGVLAPVGAQVGYLLPNSRLQESEADEIGLIFMAMAGYNPNEAIDFWQRMSKASQGGQPPQFLSTHPSHQTRIKDLQKAMPKAMKYYKKYN